MRYLESFTLPNDSDEMECLMITSICAVLRLVKIMNFSEIIGMNSKNN